MCGYFEQEERSLLLGEGPGGRRGAQVCTYIHTQIHGITKKHSTVVLRHTGSRAVLELVSTGLHEPTVHVESLKLTVVRVFTPQPLVHATHHRLLQAM